jgi:hypothetical protein
LLEKWLQHSRFLASAGVYPKVMLEGDSRLTGFMETGSNAP